MSQSQTTAQVKYPLIKKIALAVFAIWFVLYLFVWVFSPMAVRHFAIQPLANLKLQLSDTSSVRFNPFTSTVSLDDVVVLDANKKQVFVLGEGEISLHIHRLLLLQLYVSEFTIEEVKVDIVKQGKSLLIAGIDLNAPKEATEVEPSPESAQSKVFIDIVLPELIVRNVELNAQIDGVMQTVSLDKLSIADMFANQQDQALQLSLLASINGAPLELDTQVNLSNKTGNINSTIALNDFSLASISPLLTEQSIEVSGMLSFAATPLISLSQETIEVDNKQLSLGLSDLLLSTQSILIEGKNQTVVASDLTVVANTNGTIENASVGVAAEFTQGIVSIETRQNSAVNWEDISAQTQVTLLSDENGNLLPNIVVPSITVNTLHLSEDLSIDEPVPMLSFGQLNISQITFSKDQLFVDKIQIGDLNANIQVNEDKSIRSLVDTTAVTTTAPKSDAPVQADVKEISSQETPLTENTKPSLMIELNTIELLNQGLVQVNDKSVAPAYEHHLTIEMLKSGPFDSTKPDAESPFELVIIDGNYLKIEAKGHISPFSEQLDADIVAKVAELNLPSVSPYVKDGLGFEMKSGQLDVTVQVNIANNIIDGNTNLFLRGIEMASADEIEQGTIKEGKAMPLNIALGILKDDDGNIDLDVPIRGNMSEPSFGIESFLNLILTKAAMSQAESYLMNTFVPYASVVSVAMSGVDFLLKITFEPLTFNTSETGLKAENTQFLSELLLLMQDTPDLQIKTCALVTYADLSLPLGQVLNEKQKAQLKSIGEKRQTNLKRFLVDKGIASSRILHCATELDSDADAVPRIKLKTD